MPVKFVSHCLQIESSAFNDTACEPLRGPSVLRVGSESLSCLTQQSQYNGSEIVRRILELLSQEDEAICRDWINCIVADLTASAGELVQEPQQTALLVYGLQLPPAVPFICDRLQVYP